MAPLPLNLDALAETLRHDASRRLVLRRLAGGMTAIAVVGGAPARIGAAQEATPTTSPVASPGAAAPYAVAVGAFRLTAVADGTISFPNPAFPDGPAAFILADAPLEELDPALREAGLETWITSPDAAAVTVALTPLVIDTGQNLVLLDTGLGAAAPFPGTGQLGASLAAAGVDPAAIDTVFLSHAHVDHVLGTVDAAGAPAFPNARYVMGRAEFDFWTDEARVAEVFPDPQVQGEVVGAFLSVLPVFESRLELVDEAAEAEIVPGLRAVAAYGHTPGHAAVLVESQGERLLATFDAFVHPLHVEYPAWNFATDTFYNQTETTRRGILDRAAADGLLLQVYHFPFPGLGRVARQGDAWVWEPVG